MAFIVKAMSGVTLCLYDPCAGFYSTIHLSVRSMMIPITASLIDADGCLRVKDNFQNCTHLF